MRTIVQNFNYNHCCEVVEQNIVGGDRIKFKIVAENGNSYSRLNIYILNENGLQQIADKHDIPDYSHVDYISSEFNRLEKSKRNIFAAEDWIKKIFK